MAENAHIHTFWINETEEATDRGKRLHPGRKGTMAQESIREPVWCTGDCGF